MSPNCPQPYPATVPRRHDRGGAQPLFPRCAVDHDSVASKAVHDEAVTVHVVGASPVLPATGVLVDLELLANVALERRTGLVEPRDACGARRRDAHRDRELPEIDRSLIP